MMNRRRIDRVGAALVAMQALGMIGSPAGAQDVAPATAPWQLSITPYLWAVALKGDVSVGRIEADVDASFSDILDNLNGALMLELELRKGRFGLLSDTSTPTWRTTRRRRRIGSRSTPPPTC